MESSPYIWMDGELIAWDEAKVHMLTHSLHYGMAVFEGIRCYDTTDGRAAVFRLPEHMKRFLDSAKIGGIPHEYSQAALEQAVVQVVTANGAQACYIRPLMWFGYGRMGLNNLGSPVRCSIATWPWGAYLGEDGIRRGIRVIVSSYLRHHPNNNMTKAKISGNYVNSQLAKVEAVKRGYDEALMLDHAGYVVEGSGENLFMVENKTIITPPLTSILNGITRNTVIDLARRSGYEVSEQDISRDRLYCADEVFLTGTAAEVTPVREIDDRLIGDPGPVTHELQSAYKRVVTGEDQSCQHWLTVVEPGQ